MHAAAADGAGLAGLRVLVVEDELLVAMEMERLLREAGCRVLGPAPTVARALALVEAAPPPDAALLDVNLSGRRVTPVAEALDARGIPYLLVTGYSRLEPGEPVLGKAPHVSKPVERNTLVRAMSRTLLAGGGTSS